MGLEAGPTIESNPERKRQVDGFYRSRDAGWLLKYSPSEAVRGTAG
jgi:hypothetical protein